MLYQYIIRCSTTLAYAYAPKDFPYNPFNLFGVIVAGQGEKLHRLAELSGHVEKHHQHGQWSSSFSEKRKHDTSEGDDNQEFLPIPKKTLCGGTGCVIDQELTSMLGKRKREKLQDTDEEEPSSVLVKRTCEGLGSARGTTLLSMAGRGRCEDPNGAGDGGYTSVTGKRKREETDDTDHQSTKGIFIKLQTSTVDKRTLADITPDCFKRRKFNDAFPRSLLVKLRVPKVYLRALDTVKKQTSIDGDTGAPSLGVRLELPQEFLRTLENTHSRTSTTEKPANLEVNSLIVTLSLLPQHLRAWSQTGSTSQQSAGIRRNAKRRSKRQVVSGSLGSTQNSHLAFSSPRASSPVALHHRMVSASSRNCSIYGDPGKAWEQGIGAPYFWVHTGTFHHAR